MTSPPPPQPAELGRLVRETREQRGLSQETLAAQASISLASVRTIEAGARTDGKPLRPTARTLHGIIRVLHLDHQRVFELANRPFTAVEAPTSHQQIADSIRQLPPHLLPAVAEVVHALSDRNSSTSPREAVA